MSRKNKERRGKEGKSGFVGLVHIKHGLLKWTQEKLECGKMGRTLVIQKRSVISSYHELKSTFSSMVWTKENKLKACSNPETH